MAFAGGTCFIFFSFFGFFGGVNKSKIGFKRFGGKWNGLSGVE